MAGHLFITWKRIPFLRLTIALAMGILLQWYLQPGFKFWLTCFVILLILRSSASFFNLYRRYSLSFLTGMYTLLLFTDTGGILGYVRDIRHHESWIGHTYREADTIFVVLSEPPIEKTKSFKANASVQGLWKNGSLLSANGKIILYFRKQLKDGKFNPDIAKLQYGSQVVFISAMQEISSPGNPGGFDFKRYCLFQGITHQVFLQPGKYGVLPARKERKLNKFLFAVRERVIHCLRKNIPGEKERGLAEALLIGYKNDLDKSLVQSYSNTGVVHIIAISGLHLGLIYWLLTLLCKPLKQSRYLRRLVPLLIIAGLWLFSLLAGAQPSILRSAIMFTCIVLAENIYRRTSIYNSLAFSAFVLLCINPFWLWDVGFQLSYAAIVGILIFARPIAGLFYARYKFLNLLWRMNAVTIAAQVFTIPISIYHFHQFPNYFILANLVAVPLSSLILLAEILLFSIGSIPLIASLVGKLVSWLIIAMNFIVETIESLPGSVWQGLYINLVQAIVLMLFFALAGYWLLEKSRLAFRISLIMLLAFSSLRLASFIKTSMQRKLIVYNINQKSAMDVVSGRCYSYIGDTSVQNDDFINRFHIRPLHIQFRLNFTGKMHELNIHENLIDFAGRHILMIDSTMLLQSVFRRPVIDILIISKNPKLSLYEYANSLEIKQVVFDASVPVWKARKWKTECDSLRIPCHDVTQDGAFVMSIR